MPSVRGGAPVGFKFLESVSYKNCYFYLGHGSSICNANGDLEILKVPTNCALMTSSQCGIDTWGNAIQTLIDARNFNPEVFKQVIFAKENYQTLPQIIKKYKYGETVYFQRTSEQYARNFSVRLPGQDYVNSSFLAADAKSFFLKGDLGKVVHPAGLYDMETLVNMAQEKDEILLQIEENRFGLSEKDNDKILQFQTDIGLGAVSMDFPTLLDVFRFIYGRSKWPGFDEIQYLLTVPLMEHIINTGRGPLFQSDCPMSWNSKPNEVNVFWIVFAINFLMPYFTIDQSILLEKYPGIHIWDICRGYESNCKPDVQFSESAVSGGRT